MFARVAITLLLLLPAPLAAQELPEGQSEADYQSWLAAGGPGLKGGILSFEAWQQAAGVRGVLPTWQILRTASMWRQCGGQPFEVPPLAHWPGMANTLRFIRDHVRPAIGPVEAVSGYRNPALNICAGGSSGSAHKDYFALDLIPLQPVTRLDLMRRLCAMHAREGEGGKAGLGFYAFLRFHIDTRGYRRWGAAGPAGNESPCAVIERGEDPLAPPIPPLPLQGRGTAEGGGGAIPPRDGEGDHAQHGGGGPPPPPTNTEAVPPSSPQVPPKPPESAEPPS
jgi:hypothetical protein